MTLSLAEKTLLLLYGTESQEPAQASDHTFQALVTKDVLGAQQSKVVGALVMDLILQGYVRLKRPALAIQCRWRYMLLVIVMLALGMAAIVVPTVFGAAGVFSVFTASAIAVGLLFAWYVAFFVLSYPISGRLFIEEIVTQDELLALVLQRMRESGQARTCQTYLRRLISFQELSERLKEGQARLEEQGYIVTKDLPGDVRGVSLGLRMMSLNRPECQELRDQLRAFLLNDNISDKQIAALTILLSPRLLPRKQRFWPRQDLYACFAPEEYQTMRVRLKGIKAQRDQVLHAELGVTTYQALLTVRNWFPG